MIPYHHLLGLCAADPERFRAVGTCEAFGREAFLLREGCVGFLDGGCYGLQVTDGGLLQEGAQYC